MVCAGCLLLDGMLLFRVYQRFLDGESVACLLSLILVQVQGFLVSYHIHSLPVFIDKVVGF